MIKYITEGENGEIIYVERNGFVETCTVVSKEQHAKNQRRERLDEGFRFLTREEGAERQQDLRDEEADRQQELKEKADAKAE